MERGQWTHIEPFAPGTVEKHGVHMGTFSARLIQPAAPRKQDQTTPQPEPQPQPEPEPEPQPEPQPEPEPQGSRPQSVAPATEPQQQEPGDRRRVFPLLQLGC